MRIVGGKFKGRQFNPPKVMPARPTTDFAKEGLFNILTNNFDLENIDFLDLFGGTGSISYEIASRGCTNITAIELDMKLVAFIKKNFEELKLPSTCVVYKNDVFRFMSQTNLKYNLIFAGPPYPLPNLNTIPDCLFANNLLAADGWFILEHNPQHNFDHHANFYKKRNYGTTIFSIFINK
jgi:16S rRNA (guanine966-N2)-methyltransferase